MERVFRVFDFNVYNEKASSSDSGSDDDGTSYTDTNQFKIQIFGLNEAGKSCSIIAEDFKPFFYVKVDDTWNQAKKAGFLEFVKSRIGKYYKNSISDCKLIKKKKLYGFDGGKEHKFVIL